MRIINWYGFPYDVLRDSGLLQAIGIYCEANLAMIMTEDELVLPVMGMASGIA